MIKGIGGSLKETSLKCQGLFQPFSCPKRRKDQSAYPAHQFRFIAVEDNGCVFAYSIPASQLSKLCGINVVTLDLILKIPSPIDVHRTGDMSGCRKAKYLHCSRRSGETDRLGAPLANLFRPALRGVRNRSF